MLVENDDEAEMVVGYIDGIEPLGVLIVYDPTPARDTDPTDSILIYDPLSSNCIPGTIVPEAIELTYNIVFDVTELFAVICSTWVLGL
jgi:hypothetical protein